MNIKSPGRSFFLCCDVFQGLTDWIT